MQLFPLFFFLLQIHFNEKMKMKNFCGCDYVYLLRCLESVFERKISCLISLEMFKTLLISLLFCFKFKNNLAFIRITRKCFFKITNENVGDVWRFLCFRESKFLGILLESEEKSSITVYFWKCWYMNSCTYRKHICVVA